MHSYAKPFACVLWDPVWVGLRARVAVVAQSVASVCFLDDCVLF